MPIQDKGRKIDEFNKEKINAFIERLININPFTLVDMSHQHTFWADNKNEIESLGYRPSYRFKDIEEAFK
ncbi:Uncharacterised protein [Staphylococcus aureus]|nr:Uncharacterised protein [Staphylococcus aureus]